MCFQRRRLTPMFSLISMLFLNLNAQAHDGHHSTPAICEPSSLSNHLGDHTFIITTSNPKAQEHFNRGINWAYGFHHSQAEKEFRAAAALDPKCAMCYWGIAYVLGPNINAPMAPEAVPKASEALNQARALAPQVTKREEHYIHALSERYLSVVLRDRSPLDLNYAEAMLELARRYPNDLEASVLAVEAMMDTMPWNYWTQDGHPRAGTEEMIARLNRVLKQNPKHPGANHFLIHVVEKARPEWGEAAADRLVDLVPDSGHLQHMASHIYIRVGRYHDAVLANQRGIAADKKYLASCPQFSLYDALYIPHNYDFLIAAAALEGNRSLSQHAAHELRMLIEPLLKATPDQVDLQSFWSTPLFVALRFGDWTRIMNEPRPPEKWLYARALWHFGRGMAAIQLGLNSAKLDLAALEQLAKEPELMRAKLAGLNPAARVLAIGIEELKGLSAARAKHYARAVAHLERAVSLQDALVYIEPPAWYRSLRLPMGEVLLAAQRPDEALHVFEEDLQEFPDNGWALRGAYQSLVALNRPKEAEEVRAAFELAWRHADFDLVLE